MMMVVVCFCDCVCVLCFGASGLLVVVRARQEHERAPCVENSFSRNRQHDVVVAAAPVLSA